MKDSLRTETEKLERSWMRHDPEMLRDYLVAGVEDPRFNAQSILSRHFLIREAAGDRFAALMEEEHRFGAAVGWLLSLLRQGTNEDLVAVLHALRRGADNAEGTEIPACVSEPFAALPKTIHGTKVPNFIEGFLSRSDAEGSKPKPDADSLNAFCHVWNSVLAEAVGANLPESPAPLSVLELACGSANDYRFLHAYGITRFAEYTGVDLCEKNVANARAMFPDARFECANAFELSFPDKSFDVCFTHDLFEHLSLEGLEQAVSEACRVARRGICAGFFNMHERPEHVLIPQEDYFWNELSMEKTRELFAQHGFRAQAIHLGTFLRLLAKCETTHNPNAYTFWLHAS
jgi:ubiquinone/menaquinone biosynthesis C-methylase UbiE